MIKSLLRANRGEIAIRICRTAKRMGIKTYVIRTVKEPNAVYLDFADQVLDFPETDGTTPEFLDIDNLVKLAVDNKVQALHPGYGYLSENAEYDAAKEAQGMLEMRSAKLEATIAGARIIDESKLNTNTLQMLNRVTIKNINLGKTVEYTLVSENEANLKEGKLSIGTPIAQALLGKKRGDVIEVQVPSGILKLEVLDISI